ncbi:MAG: succinate dehydrogenase cytochrome b subunit [Varibaculum sp.]|nr:succinate dehydrogenase cytochrome b subunit [Varibaculum sp.]
MAEQSTKIKHRPWNTQVFMKQLMAISGVLFVLFLLMHSYGNLKVLLGPDAYNGYAHHLRTFLMPILPYEGLLWILRVGLVVLVVVHFICAYYLWWRASRARGSIKYDKKQNVVNNYATRTVRVGSILVVLFVLFHLLHFTGKAVRIGASNDYTQMVTVDGEQIPNVYAMMAATFNVDNWWALIIYVIAVGVVGLHIGHGVWSGLQTMGWLRENTRHVIVVISGLIGFAVFALFTIPPVYLLITSAMA